MLVVSIAGLSDWPRLYPSLRLGTLGRVVTRIGCQDIPPILTGDGNSRDGDVNSRDRDVKDADA